MQILTDPAILFFVFGVLAASVKSNLEIPPAISRFLSLYLLMALGLKGGFALSHSGFTPTVASSLLSALALAVLIPLAGYALLRRFIGGFDAAAVAATYGSVSAVTFVTAVQYLDNNNVPYGGHMAAAMALMESPAIILAVVFANTLRHQAAPQSNKGLLCWVVADTRLNTALGPCVQSCTSHSPMVRNSCCWVPCWSVM